MKRFGYTLSLAAVLGLVGCGQPPATTSPSTNNVDEKTHAHADGTDHSVVGHSHGAGPHDGTIADWGGGKFHVELTVDHSQQQATVYILGNDEKTPSAIDAQTIELSIKNPELQLTLQAAPQEADPPGKSSRFMGTHEKLSVVQEYAGTMTGVVDGTPYSGDFDEAHGHSHSH